jgi:outer membrane biosynthesis protein TonB
MESFDKNKKRAIAGTILFHLLVFLALFFLALRTPLPLPGEEGVEVNLGYSDQGMGQIQPEKQEAVASAAASQIPQAVEDPVKDRVVTQQSEEAPALPEKIVEKPKTKPAEKPIEKPPVEPAPKPAPEPVAEPQPQVNQRALFRGSNSGANTGSEGITGQPGDQGRPDGLRDVKRYEGQGGQGDGASFSLGGRGAKYLERPSSNFSEQGDVVVDIWVDRKGVVVRAEVSLRGTTILDTKLRNLAVKAALNSVFAEDPKAAVQQKGTITYTFIIRN